MTDFASRVHVLKLDELKEFPGKDGRKGFTKQTAQCCLLDDKGQVTQVGVLELPEHLRGKVKVGAVHRGAFSMKAREFGDKRGLIEAVLTDLTPEPARA